MYLFLVRECLFDVAYDTHFLIKLGAALVYISFIKGNVFIELRMNILE